MRDSVQKAQLIEALTAYGEKELQNRDSVRDVIFDAKKTTDRTIVRAMVARLRNGAPFQPVNDIRAVLIKLVSDHCNLRCTYCYEGLDGDRQETGRMSEEMLRHIIREACGQLSGGGDLQFLWHGGEPLLAGRELFEVGIREQARCALPGVKFRNSVQTNGTLLDKDWINFLAEADFAVGLSLDGPDYLHDTKRVDKTGGGTHSAVVRAIEQLQSTGIDFGVICVIGSHHAGYADETIRHFHDLGVKHLDLHQDIGKSDGKFALGPLAFATFMIEAFETWLDLGDPSFRINIFDDFLLGWLGAHPRTCYFNGSCGSIVAVEANGDVVPCTRPFDRTDNTFGNVRFQSFNEVIGGERLADFRKRDAVGIARTQNCRWHRLCHGGCPQHRRSKAASIRGQEDVSGINPYCGCVSGEPGGYAALWEHIASRVTALFPNPIDEL